jgi:shikimate dehydrogenase
VISGRAKLAGVIGDPIGHSLSPRLHAFWLDAYKIDGAYVPLGVAKESFAKTVRALRGAGFVGLNVTVPHKEAAFAIVERLGAEALAAGAVNLLLFHRDHVEGQNTDSAGLKESLLEALGPDALVAKPVAVVGAGGAARAAAMALSGLKAAEIRIVARNIVRADAIVRDLSPRTPVPLKSCAWSDWPRAASGIALLLNATSAGMAGHPALGLSLDPLPPGAAVCDVVYNPLETLLLAEAKARGHLAVDGLGMLMHQAVPAFEAFYGVRPKVTPALKSALLEVLRGKS